MNNKKYHIGLKYGDASIVVSPQWYRGASRYNNGATKYGKKYNFRYLMNSAARRKNKIKT